MTELFSSDDDGGVDSTGHRLQAVVSSERRRKLSGREVSALSIICTIQTSKYQGLNQSLSIITDTIPTLIQRESDPLVSAAIYQWDV